METLDGTSWDVVIAGTGIQPALLALALSRAGKKILHLDSNDYYGGAEAALSLSEAEEWAKEPGNPRFGQKSVGTPAPLPDGPKLASFRAYSLSLSPCLLHTRSALLPALVSARAHEQLEFLAVGSWFVWNTTATPTGSFVRVPNSREDIFSDTSLSLRTKSALVKFLRFVAVYQDVDKREVWEPYRDAPFADLLLNHFKIQPELQGPLLALTMAVEPSGEVKTEFALQSIHRHLTSMGVFGAGFSAVLPKYGGLSEVVQVSCRAAAVGGAVYVLNRKVEGIDSAQDDSVKVSMTGNEAVTTRHLFYTDDQIATDQSTEPSSAAPICSRSTYIAGSTLVQLFPAPSGGGPTPSAAVIVVPSNSLVISPSVTNESPIHILVHSSDTGECPTGQCVLYATTMQPLSVASSVLDLAVKKLLTSTDAGSRVLWRMQYEVHSASYAPSLFAHPHLKGVYRFLEASANPVFDDRVLETVKEAWKMINDRSEDDFMTFVDRNTEEDVADGACAAEDE